MASGHGRLSIFGFNLYFVRFCSFEQVKDALGAKNQFSGLQPNPEVGSIAVQRQRRGHEKQPNWFRETTESSSKLTSRGGGRQGEVMAEGQPRSKQGLEGECVGCIGSLPRRPNRVGGLGGLGGWSEEEKVCNAFKSYLKMRPISIRIDFNPPTPGYQTLLKAKPGQVASTICLRRTVH